MHAIATVKQLLQLAESHPTKADFYRAARDTLGVSARTAQAYLAAWNGIYEPLRAAVEKAPRKPSLRKLQALAKLTQAEQADAAIRIAKREPLAKVVPAVATEHEWQTALMLGLQRALGADLYLERRNVGSVITRDRSGAETGLFRASQVKGAADLHGYYRGVPFELECKAVGGRLSDDQKRFAARMYAVGVRYRVATAGDSIEEVAAWITA